MNKTLLILRHELTTLLSRFSFWFSVLGIPVLGFALVGGVGFVNRSQGLSEGSANALAEVQSFLNPAPRVLPQGYVDNAQLIRYVPQDDHERQLIPYADSGAAQRDLDAGKIGAYYVIPANYVQTGRLYTYTIDYDLVASTRDSRPLQNLIDYNLLQGDAALAHAVEDPIKAMVEVNISPETSEHRDSGSFLVFLLPYGMMMLYFITIMGSASLMLSSITKEKENRVMEVLMASVAPQQMMMGKIGGLGLVGLLQVVIWGGSSYILMRISGQSFKLPDGFALSPSILVWGVVFYIFGYLVYGSLMAGLGALAPNLRETSQATFLIMLPLTIPLFVISALIDLPNGPLSVALSLFPLTSPTVMILRMTAAQVPVWQLGLSALLLALTALLIIRVVANMFRAQTLLSGQPFKIKTLFLALVGRG